MSALHQPGTTLETASAKAGISENTARKYRRSGQLPSQMRPTHAWRTRQDPFEAVSTEIELQLEASPGLQATTLFEYLQGKYPGRFSEGQLRSLQRRIKVWRATCGPDQEVFFEQANTACPGGQNSCTNERPSKDG